MTLLLTVLYIWGVLACLFTLFISSPSKHPVWVIICTLLWPIAWVVGMILITIWMLVIGSGWVYNKIIKWFKK